MTYRPREFWERRLSEQFDLRGTGEPGLSLKYNQACYRLRRRVLDRALAQAGFRPGGRSVLDVGCGTGFFTRYYLERGARVTGLDIAPSSIERLRERFPGARFILADASDVALDERYDLVQAFDVLYHVTDDAQWEAALRNLAGAVAPNGMLLVTDVFVERRDLAEHNRVRPLGLYRRVLEAAGIACGPLYATHALLNRELGPLRFLNRAPELLYLLDRLVLGLRPGGVRGANKLLVARRIR